MRLEFSLKSSASALLVAIAFHSNLAQAAIDAKYDALFPQYIEMCSASQYRESADHSADGGPYGHTVLFLKGACKVPNADFPQLRACDNGPGVGVSTYFAFKNALWVATEGKSFFYDGGVQPTESVNNETIEQAIKKAESLGTLKGVEMHDWIMNGRKETEDVEHYRYRMSLGTDWALTYARNLYCVRIPVSKAAILNVVDYLNAKNKYYRNPETPYIWDLMTNNCTDTAHNAIAAIGGWAPKETALSKFKTFTRLGTDIAVPLNTLISDAQAAFSAPPTYRAVRFSATAMNSLANENWLLSQAGTVFVEYGIHTRGNTYFETASPLKGVETQGPVDGSDPEKTSTTSAYKLQQLRTGSNYSDLRSNLEWNLERFTELSNQLQPIESLDPNELAMYNLYKNYHSSQISKSRLGLQKL